MAQHQDNAKWLLYLAPFRNLSISAAYIMPFFLQNGLSLSQVFVLQSIFSGAFLLWELPSGWIADKYGRAFSIKLSVPIAIFAQITYGLSHAFWQFVVCELVLALANGLVSGVDTALLLDSLLADGREKEFVRISQRIYAVGYMATALGVPVALILVHYISIGSTLIADGLLLAFGSTYAFKLVEAPRFNGSQEAVRLSVWHAMKQLVYNIEARWLVALGAVLSAATYMGFWLSAPYYAHLGIPVVWFSVLLAIRSLWKAFISQRFVQKRRLERNMFIYALLAGLVYLAMASGQIWLMWAVLGHDVVQALQGQPITMQLNRHIHPEFRATLNSLVNLVQRLLFSVAGPFVGLLADKTSLGTAFVVTGITATTISWVVLARLHKFKTFQDKA